MHGNLHYKKFVISLNLQLQRAVKNHINGACQTMNARRAGAGAGAGEKRVRGRAAGANALWQLFRFWKPRPHTQLDCVSDVCLCHDISNYSRCHKYVYALENT